MSTSEFITRNRTADIHRLAFITPPPGVDLPYALQQIQGWQLARHKLPTWAATDGIIFPPRLALEQCSSEATAAIKAQIIACSLSLTIHPSSGRGQGWAPTLLDLTGGLGVDFFALAPLFAKATYVEQKEDLVVIARHNASRLLSHEGLNFRHSDAINYLRSTPPVDVIFLDPARRDSAGRKLALIEDCQPDVAKLQELILSKCRLCLIKLSPMLDITAAVKTMRNVAQVHVVSHRAECKEILLLLTSSPTTDEPVITCHYSTDPLSTFSFRPSEERDARSEHSSPISPPQGGVGGGLFLYEPDPSLLKAGCFKLISQRYPVSKLANNTHLYTSDQLLRSFPGRAWRIIGSSSFAKRELRTMLAGLHNAEIATRGFPVNVATLRRQLRLPDGSEAHLIATTIADGTHHLLRVEPIE